MARACSRLRLATLPAWSCFGGGQIQGRTGHHVGGLDRPAGGLVGPDQIGGQLRCAEHVAYWGLGFAGEQLIQGPQLRIQLLPAALQQLGALGLGWGLGRGLGQRSRGKLGWDQPQPQKGQNALAHCHGDADQRLG